MSLKSFKLQGSGLGRVLGALEAEIMESVWDLGDACVQDVCDHLGPKHNYKTVMTVMNRLVEKQVLVRRRESRAYIYTAAQPREQFVSSVSKSVIHGLIKDFGAASIAQFVDAVGELGPDELAELDRLVHQKADEEKRGNQRR